uniref:Beta-ketoacyl-[acyl-carrier-protein] synthase III n=1 Tax=Platysiphonia delicata TaxID=2006979 RepID=A0A1Z1M151_9FLOR|nr:Beta-ketoacyl-acyl carrier protein synthase III [Platysiphonia delicata]ARW59494.1 Beta-ketoacyl-acyl carrier protein synthase III [Platysiphonia delicata]
MKSLMMQGTRILATGSAVPNSGLSNEQITQLVDTSDEWISTRTGIQERRLLTGSNTSIIDLATLAASKALDKISMSPCQIDLIILATSTPNDLFGSASQVQAKLKALNAVSFDLTAACSGFVLAMITASQFLQSGSYDTVLVIGADVLSKWIDWSDRNTCILFGDAAGAMILQSCLKNNNQILGFQLNTNGDHYSQLCLSYKNNKSKNPVLGIYQGSFNYISMNGKEVYKFAVSQVPLSILKCLNSLNLSVSDISWLLLHQANKRIITAVADKLSISLSKIIINLNKYGNTSAASIPLALDEAISQNKIFNNDILVMSGFGAGLTWGTAVIKWKY